MAATMSPWAKPGAWALDSEENEEDLLQQQRKDEKPSPQAAPLADYPSLAAAASAKPKKKKAQTLSLAEFSTGVSIAPGSARSAAAAAVPKGLTADEILALPTGPRERTAEELERSRGFRSYSSGGFEGGRGRYSSRDDSADSRKLGFGDSSRDSAPSRADEIDDWGAAKKSSAVGNGFERRERGGFFESHSKADESDSWVLNKSSLPSEGRRFGASGFDRERRGGGGFDSFSRETALSGSGADAETWGKKREEGNGGFGGGRPRLNLQPRTLPVTNDGGQRQAPAAPIAPVAPVAKPKGANPFGEARPREEVLAEKGQDWKKIDEKLEPLRYKEAAAASEGFGGFGRRSFVSGDGRMSSPEPRSERSWRKADSFDSRPSSGHGRVNSPDGLSERSWRKADSVDSRPSSAGGTENGIVAE